MENCVVDGVIRYINRVCEDAAKSVNRDNDVQWQFCIIKNNVVFSMRSKYIKVRSRILYRLARNFDNKFKGLHFKFIPAYTYDMRMRFTGMYDSTRGFSVHELREGIDLNYSFAEWNFFGKPVTLQSFQDNELISEDAGKPGIKVANKHYENFVDLTGDPGYGMHTHDWGTYCKDYMRIYGHAPYRVEQTYKNY